MSIIEGVRRDTNRWEYYAIGILAILAIIAPFVEGYRTAMTALYASLILGIVELVLALWAAFAAKPRAVSKAQRDRRCTTSDGLKPGCAIRLGQISQLR